MQRLTVHGNRRDLGLGGYPYVGLAEARAAAFANRQPARPQRGTAAAVYGCVPVASEPPRKDTTHAASGRGGAERNHNRLLRMHRDPALEFHLCRIVHRRLAGNCGFRCEQAQDRVKRISALPAGRAQVAGNLDTWRDTRENLLSRARAVQIVPAVSPLLRGTF